MVTSSERRYLEGLGRAPSSKEDVALERMLGACAQGLKAKLIGYDVTLIVSRHAGDGAASIKQVSTLPPHVQRAVLRALVAADDDVRSTMGAQTKVAQKKE